jgi:phosphatidylinositol alpha-1,6-mannosyltransferase
MVFVFRRADRIIANSEWTRDELVRMGVDPARITLIYPGVDVDRYRPGLDCDDLKAGIGLAGGEKLILTVGRLSRRKGFDQVIRSLPLLAGRGIRARVALIGIGEDWDYLQAVAREAGVADRVHLLGHVPMEDLPRWYNACDVFAMPNRDIDGDTEGFGLVYLEAAACGKPAIAGLAGGTGAAVVDGVTGLRVDGANTEAVADGIARILGDIEFAQRLGRAGLERARRDFSWEAIAARTVPLTPPR